MIRGQNLVEIDSFGGEPIRTCGLEYSGTIVTVFWDTIARGLRKEIVAQFEWLETQVEGKPLAHAEQIINVCAGQIVSFAEAIRRDAIAKDRTLRSVGGVRATASDQGRWEGADRNAVLRQAKGLIDSLKVGAPPPIMKQDERLWKRFPAWLQVAAAVVTIVAGAVALLST